MAPEEFKRLRVRHGLTQEEAGRLLGVARNTVTRWENERHPIPVLVARLMKNPETLRKLA